MAVIPLTFANDVLGAKVIGALLNSASWGMSCIQAYTYFTSKGGKSDIAIIQYTVAVLVLMNTVHTVVASYMAYWYVVIRFADLTSLLRVPRAMSASDGLTDVMIGMIRLLFARRIWKLSHGNRWITILVCLLSLGSMGIGIAMAVLIEQAPLAQLINIGDGIYATTHHVIIAVSVMHITAELFVTLPICYYLYNIKVGIPRTDSILKILIKYAIGTGGVVIVFSVLGLVVNTRLQQTDFGSMLYMPLAGLYLGCYLAGMNSRERLVNVNGSSTLTETSIHLTSIGVSGSDRIHTTNGTASNVTMTQP